MWVDSHESEQRYRLVDLIQLKFSIADPDFFKKGGFVEWLSPDWKLVHELELRA